MKGITGKLLDFGARLTAARSALGELHGIDRDLRTEHSVVLKERSKIASLPPPAEEIVGNLSRLIDEYAVREAADMAHGLRSAFGGAYEPKIDGRLIERKPIFPVWFYRPQELNVVRLVSLFPELAKARLAEIIRRVPFEAGGPMADRLRLLEAADQSIAEIEDRHTELVDYARGLVPPVELMLLEPVRQRRENERIKAERETREREAHKRAAAAVNAAHAEATARRAVPSPYVRSAERPGPV